MTTDFSPETVEARKNGTTLSGTERKKCQPQIPSPTKIFFRKKGNKDSFGRSKRNIICCHQTYSKRMAKLRSVNRKEMIVEGFLEH